MAGFEAPGDIIKRRFGLDMSKQHFSATKSKLKSTEAAQKPSPKTAPKTSAPKTSAPKAAAKSRPEPVEERQPTRPAGGEGDLLSAMEAMKPLVESLGKEQVKRMVDLLG